MLVFIFSAFVFLPYVVAESCYYKRCLGCHPANVLTPEKPIECHPNNWVSPEWVHMHGHPPPSTGSRVPIEYRCLKMIATPDDRTFGDTVDILKGCVPKLQVDSVCMGLEAVERARGHSNVRCHVCRGNNCNSAVITQTSFLGLFISILLYVFK